MFRTALLAITLALLPLLAADSDKKEKDDFTPLFNGKDLTGWVRVNNAPGTFFVRDDCIVTTGKPTGFMRTAKMYENFILEMEWKHVPPNPKAVGNSGLFLWCDGLPAVGSPFTRGIEVQVLVNLEYKDKKGKVTASSHGDIFSIHGATCEPDRPHPGGAKRCIPSEYNAKGANEWNHYRVVAKDGVIKLAVNGKEVSGVSKSNPRKGYLALEAEGSECQFRNLKIKELPSSKPTAKESANETKDFVTLFTGMNLDGWTAGEDKSHWKVGDNVIDYDGKAKDGSKIETEKQYGDVEVVLDYRLPKDGGAAGLYLGGSDDPLVDLSKGKPGVWNRLVVSLKGAVVAAELNGAKLPESRIKAAKAPIVLKAKSAGSFMNLFVRQPK